MEPYHTKHSKIIDYYKKESLNLKNTIEGLYQEQDPEYDRLIDMLTSSYEIYSAIARFLNGETLDIEEKQLLTYTTETFELVGYSDKEVYLKENYDFLDSEQVEIICSFMPSEVDNLTLKYIRDLSVNKNYTLSKRIRLYRINKRI